MQRPLQLALDGFDPAPFAPATPAPPAADPPSAGPDLPTQTLEQALAPLHFTHPRAERRTVLQGVHVAYEFRRMRRRNIGFSVDADGLTVSAPQWVPLYEIEAALQKKAAWIVRKLGEARERSRLQDASRIEWQDGAVIPFLGEQVIVVLDPRETGAVLRGDRETLPGVAHMTLHVGLPQRASPEQIRDAVQSWLMRQATRVFTERLQHYAPRLGVRWTKLSLSSASTRWGTASSTGAIRLNWRLIHFRLSVIDYVVAHELSHLRVMDHSPRFWDTVATVMPDYAELRAELRSDPLPPW